MAVPAPPNILTKLPFDIRNQIWINVLSQTGYVKVVPERHFRSEKLCILEVSNNSSPNEATAWDFHGTIDLSLLRTCIQIYEETQEMFWRYNTLVLYPMRRGFISQYSDMLEEELGSVCTCDSRSTSAQSISGTRNKRSECWEYGLGKVT
jgi:hypothetical protein